MKILFVANRVPYPPFRGDKLKIYNLARQLKPDHELHLITIAETQEDLNYSIELEEVFHKVTVMYLPKWKSFMNTFSALFSTVPFQVAYFRFPEFAERLKGMLGEENFDAIHVQHLRMSGFFADLDRNKVILDLPDAFSLYWQRRSDNAQNIWMRKFAAGEYKRLLKYEKEVLPLFDLNLVCSTEDRKYLTELTGAHIELLPNGVDTDQFRSRPDIAVVPERILFTGNMDYEPNIDAVEYFVRDIFPEVLKTHPTAKFIIAGQRPVKRVLNLASENVEVTGFVEDICAEYAKATVVVAPLRFGAGTQNKVLEAMAVGSPVICTEVGFKGLGIESGQGALQAKSREDFIRELLHILENREYRHRISFAGRNIIQSGFGWKGIADKLVAYMEKMPG